MQRERERLQSKKRVNRAAEHLGEEQKMGSFGCVSTNAFHLIILTWIFMCLRTNNIEAQVEPPIPPDSEVEALHEIAEELGKKDWNFSENPCNNKSSWFTPSPPPNVALATNNSTVTCNCSFPSGECHIDGIHLRGQDLGGVLPRSLSKLSFLKTIDLHGNYINGTIPLEWAAMNLEFMSLSMNHLTGSIPAYLGNITTLVYLSLENNLFSGTIPLELGKLVSLENLIVGANFLSGEFPSSLSNLSKLTELRISSNNFTGKLPNIFQSWKQLEKLEIQASGFEGPIPPSLAVLDKLTELRISDLHGEGSVFPNLQNMTNINRLMLRSCNISGPIPEYIWEFSQLQILDLSFNRLEGKISDSNSLTTKSYMYLTSNMLTGPIPEWLNNRDSRYPIDLSYNYFSESSEPVTCRENLNLFKSSSGGKNLGLNNCLKNFPCSTDHYSVHINCGGAATTIGNINYEGDEDTGGPAKYFPIKETWETSTSGHFWDTTLTSKDYIAENVSILSTNNSELYTRARLSPLSLTYYFRCLENGNYTVTLHFAEIVIRDNRSFQSLGRRIFDVYVQEKLALKDFNIKNEAEGVDKEVTRKFKTVVRDKTLTIRFHWAGKGTTASTRRATYGPLISAISVDSLFKPPAPAPAPAPAPSDWKRKKKFVVAVAVSFPCLILMIFGILWWKGCFGDKTSREQVLRGLHLQTGFFTANKLGKGGFGSVYKGNKNDSKDDREETLNKLERIRFTRSFSYHYLGSVTEDFTVKLGEGGFGSVFYGSLPDGTKIAVKRLYGSGIGQKSFLAEVETLRRVNHVNLVNLIGFCAQESHRLLVYECMQNGSLDRWIFGRNQESTLSWKLRQKIICDVAKGLAYLHHGCNHKILHLDIKPQNILLDENFTARLADFGLSKLIGRDQKEVLTTMRGTPGYMAPEWSSATITEKVDVYSFGIVVLEILCGRRNVDRSQPEGEMHLLSVFKRMAEEGKLMELVDKISEEMQSDGAETLKMVRVAAWCLQADYTRRPTMRKVLKALEGELHVKDNLNFDFLNPSRATATASNRVSTITTVALPSILSGPR